MDHGRPLGLIPLHRSKLEKHRIRTIGPQRQSNVGNLLTSIEFIKPSWHPNSWHGSDEGVLKILNLLQSQKPSERPTRFTRLHTPLVLLCCFCSSAALLFPSQACSKVEVLVFITFLDGIFYKEENQLGASNLADVIIRRSQCHHY